MLGAEIGLDEGAEDGCEDGSSDGNEMACCLVLRSAETKGLKTTSKMAAETASKMARLVVSSSASRKGLKTALACDKLGADEAAEVAIGDCSPYAVKGSNTEGPEDVVADGC